MTMAMTTTTTMTAPSAHSAVRTLRDDELDEVAGGLAQIGLGIGLAMVGGIGTALNYAGSTVGQNSFSWRTFVGVSAQSAAIGFMTGAGGGLLFSAARGARVLGAGMLGGTYAYQTATGVASQSQGGGSE
jgi:hypothetical protein